MRLSELPSSWKVGLAGVSFSPDYPDNIHQLWMMIEDQAPDAEPLAAILVREPDNPYDPNAVAVHAPSIGMLGHVPRALAASLAQSIDSGDIWSASVAAVRIRSDHMDRPGVDIAVQRVIPEGLDT